MDGMLLGVTRISHLEDEDIVRSVLSRGAKGNASSLFRPKRLTGPLRKDISYRFIQPVTFLAQLRLGHRHTQWCYSTDPAMEGKIVINGLSPW